MVGASGAGQASDDVRYATRDKRIPMITIRYTQWDGTQRVRLNAEQVFEKLSEYLSYTDDVQQALDWLMRQGAEFDGMRVLGLDDFLEQLRDKLREHYRDFNLNNALDDIRQRLE